MRTTESRRGEALLVRTQLGCAVALLVALAASCGTQTDDGRVAVPGQPGRFKTAAVVRADRRAYDGAPPTIPHTSMGVACTSCHNDRGLQVTGLGFAPPSPHERTAGLSALSRCEQCHVYRSTDAVFVASEFTPLAQDLRKGHRLYPGAPPVMPHGLLMRENCSACHTGAAAREEVRCTHPERARCNQCHVASLTTATFERL